MDEIVRSGDADFLALARPFVREPDLVNKLLQGRRGSVDCVSCNICFLHEGIDPLQCWRTPSAMSRISTGTISSALFASEAEKPATSPREISSRPRLGLPRDSSSKHRKECPGRKSEPA
jgi:hypothetical protein